MTSPLAILATPHRVSQIADAIYEDAVSGTVARGTTARQMIILDAVSRLTREDGAPSQTAIVAATNIDRSTVAEVVRRLVTNNLLQRKRSKGDARCYAVRLTGLGQQMVEAARSKAPVIVQALKLRVAGLEALSVIEPSGAPPMPAAKARSGKVRAAHAAA